MGSGVSDYPNRLLDVPFSLFLYASQQAQYQLSTGYFSKYWSPG
jgi:hypothetical protein